MSKKKRISLIVSLVLIAAIGVGATLALLSTKTNTLTNTFDSTAVIGAEILETDITDPTTTTAEGNAYDLMAGDEAKKDPFVRLAADSVASYVYIKVTGLDDLVGMIDTDIEDVIDAGTWVKVSTEDTLDGIYRYKEVVAAGADTDPLFNTITYSIDNDGTEDFSANNIVLNGLAVQAQNVDDDEADVVANTAASWN
ncbi:hypothetical protein [Ohessyouella blattaphilus]|uniref:SipW-cognate class signal peptide n=1 Tax=Ohessyouella blattaphilus TaxID=2949333 RepID=A0ABT1EL49_9FIRM|nr:hypothetical protein [Ohessyouella blattaphilus]MCP1111199.1 hypothetical protein [Ohessyouella blattaphilus]MCR8564593.1 hypothetical protein [Ohessyouella blattaphilus]